MSKQHTVRVVPPSPDLREAAQKLWSAAVDASCDAGGAQAELVVVDLDLEEGSSPRASPCVALLMFLPSREAVTDAVALLRHRVSAPLSAPVDPRIARVIKLLREHPARFRTSEELAGAVHLTASRLRALCRERLGMSTAALRQRIRLQIASERLVYTEARVSEIAYGVGFESIAHFDRAFRRLYGETPTQYRRNITPSERINI